MKFEHTVGSHSDDRGGESDKRCTCQDTKATDPANEPQSSSELAQATPKTTQDDKLDIERLLLRWRFDDKQELKAKEIADEINKRAEGYASDKAKEERIDELRSLAKVLADRKPYETWKAWSWRVSDVMKARLMELQAEREKE